MQHMMIRFSFYIIGGSGEYYAQLITLGVEYFITSILFCINTLMNLNWNPFTFVNAIFYIFNRDLSINNYTNN
jgi:hypothetical protein